MGGTSVKLILISWLFTIPFNLGYVHIINSGLKDVYIKNSSDILKSPSWFMKCVAVNVWYYMKEIKIIFVLDCRQ